ncbi:MAG: LPP20 family lipoprotein [Elusimicrobiota bacterium]
MIDRRLALVAVAALLGAACAAPARASSSRPSWADTGDSSEFPRARYVTGVGNADDETSAAERARGEVAKVFSADVNSVSTVSESEANGDQNGKKTHSWSNDVAQKVRTATQKVLEGVNIVARWKDSTGRCYALAALPKDEALLAITEKSTDIDKEGADNKAALAAATDPFARAKAAAKLLALAKAQDSLAADYRVLGGGALQGSFDGASVRAQAAAALAALDVLVAVAGDGSEAVQSAIVSGLNAVGLTAKAGAAGDKADLTAVATVTVQEQNMPDRLWRRARSTAAISLTDGRTGKIFATLDVTAREDARDDYVEARRRSLVSLSKDAAKRVSAAINDFFANQ